MGRGCRIAPFAQIILVREIVTSLHHFVVTSSSRGSHVRPIYASSIFPLQPSRRPKPPLPHEPLPVSSLLSARHDVLAQQAAEADRLSSALTATSPDPDIKTPSDINQVLAQLFSAVSLRIIALRQGALLAYIAQRMIQTTKVADVKAQLPKSQ